MFRAHRTFVATGLVALLAVAGVTAAIAADPAPPPPPKIAFLANGIVPADALAAGPIAGQLGAPVYTTRQETLSTGTADALTAYNPELVVVMGGPVAISDAVVTQVSAATGLPAVDPTPTPATGVVRAAGGDRFETATIVADLLAAYAPAYLPVDDQAVDADLLDGMDASSLVRAASDSVLNNALVGTSGDAASVTITAPTSGALMISASADVFLNTATGSDTLSCHIEVDTSDQLTSERAIALFDGGNDENWEENCATDAYVAVTSGDHAVDFEFLGVSGGTTVDEAVLNVLFVPFGADGTQIAP